MPDEIIAKAEATVHRMHELTRTIEDARERWRLNNEQARQYEALAQRHHRLADEAMLEMLENVDERSQHAADIVRAWPELRRRLGA